MKRTILFSLVLTGLLLATVLAYQPLISTAARAAVSPPAANVPMVPLFRLYAETTGINFYTADPKRRDSAIASGAWKQIGITGYVFDQKVPDTVPLYMVETDIGFGAIFGYTISFNEVMHLTQKKGWYTEGNGIACYVAATQLPGTLPLYRLYRAKTGTKDSGGGFFDFLAGPEFKTEGSDHIVGDFDNFYTTSQAERDSAVANAKYTYLRREGYIWTQPTPSTPKIGPGKPVGDADTVLLNQGCTRPAVGEYKCPTPRGYETCEAYKKQGSVKACSTTANLVTQASIDKLLFSLGCTRFLGRADEFMCKTQTGLDLCETYRKNGKLKKCLMAK
jgi:hypothetical protein